MVTKARIDIIGRDKTKAAFRSAEGSLKRFRATALSIGGAIGVGLFANASRSAIEFADGIDKAAKAAGVSTKFLQEMRFAGDQLGVSTKQVDEGFRRFGRRLGLFAIDQSGPAAKAIERLGININDMQGNFRGSEAIFRDFVIEMQQFESFAKKSAIAAEIFGDDAGPKMALLVEQGADGIAKLSKEARDIGAVLSDEVIRNSVQAKDDLAKLASVLQSQVAVAMSNLTPLITSVADAFVSLSKKIKNAFGGADPERIKTLTDRLEDLQTRGLKTTGRRGTRGGGTELQIADTIKAIQDELIKLGGSQGIRTALERVDENIRLIEQRLEKSTGRARNSLKNALTALKAEQSQLFEDLAAEELEFKGGISTKGLIDTEGLKSDVKAILARLNPLQAAAIKFNEEVKKIELSDLGADEKIAAMRQLEQEFAAATGGAREFADSTKEFETLKDRLFPLQAAAKQFNSELALIKRNTVAGPEQDEAIRRLEDGFAKATGKNRELQKENKKLGNGAIDMGFAFESAFEDAVLGGEKFGDVLDGLLKDLQKIALRQLITAPAGNALSAGISRTFPAFASGTNFAPGGIALVGERGPELVDLPRGSRVSPGVGGTTVNIVNATGEKSEVKRTNDSSGRETINVMIGEVARNIQSGGIVAQAMQGAYGVRRQGILRT